MRDYLPERDNLFVDWLRNLAEQVAAQAESLPVSAEEVAELAAAQRAFAERLAAHDEARRGAKVARLAKDKARAAAERIARRVAGRVGAYPELSPEQITDLGLRERKATRSPAVRPGSMPIVNVRVEHGRHRLRIQDMEIMETVRGRKPAGALGCEIWMGLGEEAPAVEEAMRLVGICTSGRHVVTFPEQEAGKKAWYRGRWFNRRHQGPWGPLAGARVA